jgi:hypothetical protein
MERHSQQRKDDSQYAKVISDITFSYWFLSESKILQLEYIPAVRDTEGQFSTISQLKGVVSWGEGEIPQNICQKFESLEQIVIPLLPKYELGTGDHSSSKIEPVIDRIICAYNVIPTSEPPSQFSVVYFFLISSNEKAQVELWDSLSRSQRLIVSNISSWVKQQAWEGLANKIARISGQTSTKRRAHKVFISYKKNSKSEQVAEIVANRLSQQHIIVWFDKWEIKAGDSIPGKIGEGFKDVDTCLLFLSQGYSSSDWCTKEMNTALVKAINEHLTIIPILVETCDVPELLKDLKYIGIIEPTASEFEQDLVEITDAIYKVDLNPYR